MPVGKHLHNHYCFPVVFISESYTPGMKRRTKVSAVAAAKAVSRGKGELSVGETRGLVSPVSGKTTTVTLRLSGPWHELWAQLRAAVPGVSDAELLRQGVALRMALAALDAKGKKPRATIQFYDDSGSLVTADLEVHVGISKTSEIVGQEATGRS